MQRSSSKNTLPVVLSGRHMRRSAVGAVVICFAAATTTVPDIAAATASATAAIGQSAAATSADGLTIKVVNHNPSFSADNIWVYARGTAVGQSTPTVAADSMPLSARDSFRVNDLRSGQVFVSLGKQLPTATSPSPDTSPVRFDTVELTYPGVANLTAVDMFGIPLDIDTFDANGNLVASKKWACYTDSIAQTVRTKLAAAGGDYNRVTRRGAAGEFLRLVSPNIVSGLNPSGYPRLDRYVTSLVGQQLTIRGNALGRTYRYTGAFAADPADPGGPGSITLTDQGPDHLPSMYVKGSSLPGNDSAGTNAIYSNNGAYYLGGDGARPHFVGENDIYSAAYRDLVAGFAYGFWGSPAYGNDSENFEVRSVPGPFEKAQPIEPNYNIWAAALFPYTQAYGFPFGDTFNDSPVGNPLVGLPTNGTLQITVDPDVSPAVCAGTPVPPPTPTPTPTPPAPTPTPTSTPTPPSQTPSPTPTPTPTPPSPTPTPTPTATPIPTQSPAPTPAPTSGSPRSAYARIEAESAAPNSGGVIEGTHVGSLANGDYLGYGPVDFGTDGLFQVQSLVAGGSSGSGLVRYRIDSPTGPVLGDFAIGSTGGWNSYRQIPANAGGATGVHQLFVTFESGYKGDYVNLDRFQFQRIGTPIPDLTKPDPIPPTTVTHAATPAPSQTLAPTPTATPTPTPPAPTPTPTPTAPTSTSTPVSASAPCGALPDAPPRWDHVVWIVMENHGSGQVVGSANAPFLNSLIAKCGLATNMHAITHPSLPNYLALTSGSTQGVTDDAGPPVHPLAGPSIFSQLGPGRWRAVNESMPSNCQRTSSGSYVVHHNPATYYTNVAAQCASQDVTLTTPPDLSAPFTFITPNNQSNTHDTTISYGDSWLSNFVPRILDSAEYRAGRTLVVITYDEDEGTAGNKIATVLMAPSIGVGVTDATNLTHYSLLRTTEELLGLPLLGNAATANSMRAGFHL